MIKTCHNLILTISAAALIGGCASEQRMPHATLSYDSVNPSLVTSRHASPLGWEDARNDGRVQEPVMAHEITVIRHRETLRTINGRPREYTTTRSHSLRWHRSP